MSFFLPGSIKQMFKRHPSRRRMGRDGSANRYPYSRRIGECIGKIELVCIRSNWNFQYILTSFSLGGVITRNKSFHQRYSVILPFPGKHVMREITTDVVFAGKAKSPANFENWSFSKIFTSFGGAWTFDRSPENVQESWWRFVFGFDELLSCDWSEFVIGPGVL